MTDFVVVEDRFSATTIVQETVCVAVEAEHVHVVAAAAQGPEGIPGPIGYPNAVSVHEAAVDPHPQYQTEAESDARYDMLGAADEAVTAHEAVTDPHPQYQTQVEGDARYDPLGSADGAVASHESDSDPHPQYQTQAESDARYDPAGAANDAVAAHEASSDPHAQYLNVTRADLRYDQLGAASSAVTEHAAASGVHIIAAVTGLQAALDAKVPAAEKGAANGVAPLDSGGKVPVAYLPASIMEYQGTWSAATNTPTLADGTGNRGDVYRTTAAATVNLGSGAIEFKVGDYVIYNGTAWEKSPTTDSVPTVFGRTGNVVAADGDYAASQIVFTPAGNLSSTRVQAALQELDSEKQASSSILSALAGLSLAASTLVYAAGASAFATTSISATGISLVGAADGAAVRSIAGLGSLAVQEASSVAITGGTITGTPISGSTGAFTTGSFSGQITSTVATGTAPFVIASTTVVPNLNASLLGGKTFADPGPIGSGTASTGAFTTLSATGDITTSAGKLIAKSGSNQIQTHHNGSVGYIETAGGASTPLVFAISAAEVGRFDTSGNLLVNQTGTIGGTALGKLNSSTSSSSVSAAIFTSSTNSTTSAIVNIATTQSASTSDYALTVQSGNGSTITTNNLFIKTNGNVLNTNNSYGAISDPDLKFNITKASSQLDDVELLAKIAVNYNLLSDPEGPRQLGFISRDKDGILGVRSISPGLVQENIERDEDGNEIGRFDSVAYSVAYMKGFIATGELITRSKDHESRLATLENAVLH